MILRHTQRLRRTCAFSLIEVVISLLIVAGLLIAALNTLGATRTGQVKLRDQLQAQMLAQQLLAEILQQQYAEPDISILGVDSGETPLAGNRSAFDDVDDYDGLVESPPSDRLGNAVTTSTMVGDWKRQTSVKWVEPTAPSVVVSSESGLKRITVTVSRGDTPLAELTALRAKFWPDLDTTAQEIDP